MKTRSYLLVCGLLLLGVLMSSLIPLSVVKAFFSPLPAASPSSQESSPEGEDYLVLLPFEAPQSQELLSTFKPAQRQTVLLDLIYQRTKPLRKELEQLRAQGLITGFEVRPDLYGVVVHGLTQDGMRRLQNLPDVGSVLPKDSQNQTCAALTATAFTHQVESLGYSLERREALENKGGFEVLTTNPTVNVTYYSDGYSWVDGQTSPNTQVNLRVLRGSTVVVTTSTTSDSWGWYYFYPDWVECPTSSYTWTLQPGDVVEVSAGGRTASTVVAYIYVWADPQNDQVGGKTDPGRQVEIYLYYFPNDPCTGIDIQKTVLPDVSGNFTASMGVDFDGQAYGQVFVRDANGNSTRRSFSAYYLLADMRYNSVWGVIKPGITFTATLKRGSNTLESYPGVSDPDGGYFWLDFINPFQPGDEIDLNSGDIHLRYVIAPLNNVVIDPVNNQVSGVTSPNHQVQGNFIKNTYYDIVTACDWGRGCASTTSGSEGGFTLTSPMDIVRGDEVDIYIVDDQGNYQYHFLRVPVIGVDISEPSNNRVIGAWITADRTLTVTHKTSGGSVRQTISEVYLSNWSNEFDVSLINDIISGDRIEVSDGTISLEMSVPDPLPTASLKTTDQALVGSAPIGSFLLSELYDHRRDIGYTFYYCSEMQIATNNFALGFYDAQIGGGDTAYTWIRLPNTEYLIGINRNALQVTHPIGSTVMWITYTPRSSITIEWWRGSTLLGKKTQKLERSWIGYYLDETPSPGDLFKVSSDDGQKADITIPQLTINLDRPNNRIYGRAVPNRPLGVGVWRYTGSRGYGWYQMIWADSNGNYSASFNGQYWWDCSPIQIGHRCAAGELRYYTPEGHFFYLASEGPVPAPADAYEFDNDRDHASVYTAVQTHTFHIEGDEDWVTFTVPTEDVGKVVYRIVTVNKGWDVDTVITLYDNNGNQIPGVYDRWDGIYWVPQTAGKYYVKISPLNDYSTAHCDAYYDLLILPIRAEVYLPLVRR